MTKVFIDGSYGTTGLRIHQRLQSRTDLKLISIPYEERHSESARRRAYEEADFVFMCLPDAAAKEAAPMAEACHTRVIDASTAHRTAEGWVYGFRKSAVPKLLKRHPWWPIRAVMPAASMP